MVSRFTIYEVSQSRRWHQVLKRVWTGGSTDPIWERPSLILILVLNAGLNFWNLGINSWANYFYTAAVQSGTKDLTAAFYGSSDWGNSITVDKPPLSLWVMELSASIFGLSPVSILAPQALMGVASTLLIYKIIRVDFSASAALIAAVVFFTTPIVVLMSRYNNPDPLMLLLMIFAVFMVQRAVMFGMSKHLLLAAIALGLAFMTKQLQGLLVLPSLAAAYLVWANISWTRKFQRAGVAMATIALTGGLWMTVVDLTPPNSRPYVGGSPSNRVLELTLGYNGVDRVLQTEDPVSNLIPEQFRQVDSDAGLARLLNANYGQEIGWLLPCAVLCSLAILAAWKLLPPENTARATAFISITWFMGTYLILCFMGSQIHTYYTAALAPPLSLTLGVAAHVFMQHRNLFVVRAVAAFAVLSGAVSSWLLLSSVTGWPDWLGTLLLILGALATASIAVSPPIGLMRAGAAMVAACAVLTAPVVTSLYSVSLPHNGSNPVSGQLTKSQGSVNRFLAEMQSGNPQWAYNLAFGQRPDGDVVELLRGSSGCVWAAATSASQTAARLQIDANRPVMPVGGFAGTDPSPTLQQFVEWVRTGEVCYFLDQEELLATQDQRTAAVEISEWVRANFDFEVINGRTVYNLKKGASGA